MKHSCLVKLAMSAALLGFLALGLAPTAAFAQTNPATTTIAVSATVLKDCIVAAAALPFGNYTGAVNEVQTSVTVTCTSTTAYTVALDKGLNGASATTRKMKNGAALLNYGLYSDAAWTTNWGYTVGTDTVAGTGNGAAQVLPVYGQIPAGQYVTPGSYADTITVNVAY